MKSKILLLLPLIILSSLLSKAQDIIGFNTGNYAGISGIDINPASIADSRYKFDMGVGFGFTFTNNYVGLGSKELFNGSMFSAIPKDHKTISVYSTDGLRITEVDTLTKGKLFSKDKLVLNKSNTSANKMIYQGMSITMPSFMISLSRNISVAFTWNIREVLNLDNVTPNLAEISFYGNDPKNRADLVQNYWKKQLNNDGLALNAMAWNEFGIGYAQVINSKGVNFLKVGGRVKLDWGVDAAYLYGRDVNYRWIDKTHLDLLQAKFGYGHSDHIQINGNGLSFGGLTKIVTDPGFVFDMGAIYEYRPGDKSEFTYDMDGEKGLIRRDVNKYKFRIGASLVDLGVIPYTKGDPADDFSADVKGLDINTLKLSKNPDSVVYSVDTLVNNRFKKQNSSRTFNFVLPAALSFQIDYHIWKGFYANLTTYTHPSFIYKNEEHLLHTLDYYSLTPRWESKWIGVYMPMSIIQTGEFMFGTTLRLGPLVIGTSDITPWLGKESIRGIDLHVGVKIPIMWGRGPRDTDHDGVSNRKDKCPKEPGAWENQGCPANKKVEKKAPPVVLDKDKDGVPDAKDSCPDMAGSVKLNGCPDKDHDGIADKYDKCPDDSGIAALGGCPDKDADGVPDKDDKCPTLPGLKEHHGCPDSDGDGVYDDIDNCPKDAGTKENNGCPAIDTDKDGVTDAIDKCPTIAGPKENNGCPWGDKDADGVLDNVDQCPETPGPVSNNGCPVIEKKVQQKLDSAVTGLQFESGKDVIKPISFSTLDKVAKLMKENADYRLTLAGHTDNVGNAAANLELSRKRAEAVKKYFTDKGIDANRIDVSYFGATKPIAPNTTEAGRAMNRRVAMKLLFK